jgi:hypothetical protein
VEAFVLPQALFLPFDKLRAGKKHVFELGIKMVLDSGHGCFWMIK